MSNNCIDCDKFDNGGTVYINQPQEPFCEQCGADNVCREKLDAKCVIYHSDNVQPTHLQNLAMPNLSSAEAIFEAIDDLIGNSFNVPIIVTPTNSILLTASGASNHTLKADLIISPDAGNIVQIKNNGVYASNTQDWKVKVNAADTPGYLVEQLVGGTDSIVSISTIVASGQIQIQPSIDLTALVAQLCQRPAFMNCIIDHICTNEEFVQCFLNTVSVNTAAFAQFCALVSACKCGFNVTGLAKVYAPACPTGYVLSGEACVRTESIAATVGGSIITACASSNSAYTNYGAIVYTGGFTADGRGLGATLTADITAGNVVQLPSPPTNVWSNVSSDSAVGPMNRAGVWGCSGTSTGIPYGFSIPVNVPSTKTYYIGIGGDDEFLIRANGTTLVNTQGVASGTHFAYYAGDLSINFRYWHIYPVVLNAGLNYITISGIDTSGVAAGFAAEIYDNTLAELQAATLDSAYILSPTTFPLNQNIYSNLNLLFSTRCARQTGSKFSVGNATCPDSTWTLDTSGAGALVSPCQGINASTSQWTCKRITSTAFTGYTVTLSWNRADGAINYDVQLKPTGQLDIAYVTATGSPVNQSISGSDVELIISGLPDQNFTFRVRSNFGTCFSDWEVL